MINLDDKRKHFLNRTDDLIDLVSGRDCECINEISINPSEWTAKYASDFFLLYINGMIDEDIISRHQILSNIARDYIYMPLDWACGEAASHEIIKKISPRRMNIIAPHLGELFHPHKQLLLSDRHRLIFDCALHDFNSLLNIEENCNLYFKYNTVLQCLFALDRNDTINKLFENKDIKSKIIDKVGMEKLVSFACTSHNSHHYLEKIINNFKGICESHIEDIILSREIFMHLPRYYGMASEIIEKNIKKIIDRCRNVSSGIIYEPISEHNNRTVLDLLLGNEYISDSLINIYAKNGMRLSGDDIVISTKIRHSYNYLNPYFCLTNYYDNKKYLNYKERSSLAFDINKILFRSYCPEFYGLWEVINKNEYLRTFLSTDVMRSNESCISLITMVNNIERSRLNERDGDSIDVDDDLIIKIMECIGDIVDILPEAPPKELIAVLKFLYVNRDIASSILLNSSLLNHNLADLKNDWFRNITSIIIEKYTYESVTDHKIKQATKFNNNAVEFSGVIVIGGDDSYGVFNRDGEGHCIHDIIEYVNEYNNRNMKVKKNIDYNGFDY